MGLFSMFGKSSKVDRITKKLTNAYVQTQDRQRAMEQLVEIGTHESLMALLQRFTYRVEASITDDEEKALACHFLTDAGASAIEPIKEFVNTHEAVYWPLKALKTIAGEEMAVRLLLKALDRADASEGRQNEQKVQLVANLRDFPHPEVQARLVELLSDPSEEVRILAVDGLLTYGEEVALPPAMKLILNPEESLSLKTVVLEQVIENGWAVTPWRKELSVEGVLPLPYQLGEGDLLVREV